MEINDVTYSSVNGGCFRALVSHRGRYPVSGSVEQALHREHQAGLGLPQAWEHWGQSVRRELSLTRRLLIKAKATGQHTYLYGASTRGGTFLQLVDVGPDLLDCAVDRQAAKVGKIMAAVNIPVISEKQMRAESPEYLLVSPWFFRDMFVKREAEYLRGGGQMVFPLPHFEVVG
jgi:NDP-4-keto-2,6-dideoxyhexose 3-C-methyltransferase